MKKHSFIVEITFFLLIFLFFALPPLFYPLNHDLNLSFSWNFPWRNLILCLFSVFIYSLYNDDTFSFIKFLPFIFTLGLLFFSSLIFKAIDVLFIKADRKIQFELPQNFKEWLFCLLGFLFSAFYEEVLYRFYLPESLLKFVELKVSVKKSADFTSRISILCEIMIALLFAFAHLYLGWLSVINALAAHIILRITYKKSKGIWAGFMAHFIYNIISLILL